MHKVCGNMTLALFHVFISKEDIHMICIVFKHVQKYNICVVKFPQSAFQ